MRKIRTDLAMESFQASGRESMPGVKINCWEEMGIGVTEVIVDSEEAAGELGKPRGTYLTLECAALRRRDMEARLAMANLLGEELSRLVHPSDDAPVLVIGLGNRTITPDALGPQAIDRVLVTRHMFREIPEYADRRMRSVCAIAPGVLGVTGIETVEMVESLVKSIHPRAVLCIDSLAARAADRICSTVQITDTGIQPGSGVGNHRRALTKETLGVEVVSLGIPTVIYAATLARDAMEMLAPEEERENDAAFNSFERELKQSDLGDMIVTPREIDALIADAAEVIAAGVNRALQPELSDEEIMAMMD